jgi:hypothetical protein
MADRDERMVGGADTGAGETVAGGFIQSLVDIFVDPMKVFRRIDRGLTWWKPFILIVVVSIFLQWLMLPVQHHVLSLNEQGMGEQELQQRLEMTEKFGFFGLIMIPVFMIIVYLILAGITHLIISIFSSESNFKKSLSLISYCGLVVVVEQVLTTVIVKLRGLEAIETAADARPSLSLSALFPEIEGFWRVLLQSLSVFQIWYYVLFILGAAVVFKIKRSAAVVPAVVLWLISLVILYFMTGRGAA